MERLELSLRNRPEEKRRLRRVVARLAAKTQWPALITNEIELILEEWFTNIISYAFDDNARHEIVIRFASDRHQVEIETEDDGRLFDPTALPSPDINRPIEERQIGGMGIFMIRKLSDEVRYHRSDGHNFFLIKKSLAVPKLVPKK